MQLTPMRIMAWHWVVFFALFVGGCATTSQTPTDSVDVLLDAPLDHVRAAILQVLSTDGYPIGEGTGDDRVVITGYKREIEGVGNWLLKVRFGVGRSRVEATLSPASQETTRVTISVLYQVKEHIWSIWEDAPAPPHRDASLQVRSVKKQLGLL